MTGEKARILLVDDDHDACANLVDILSALGYTVDVAHDGDSALSRFEQHPYELALLDLKMPGMDGLELLRRIRQKHRGARALIVTAFASQAAEREAVQAGAWRIVSKPLDVPRLIGLLDEATESPLVLIVDDDSELCDSLADLFAGHSFRVGMAHNLAEARAALAAAASAGNAFQVVLIDMKLPDGDGGELLGHVRERYPAARTILITGDREENSHRIEAARGQGADAVCYKPFDVARLAQIVQELAR